MGRVGFGFQFVSAVIVMDAAAVISTAFSFSVSLSLAQSPCRSHDAGFGFLEERPRVCGDLQSNETVSDTQFNTTVTQGFVAHLADRREKLSARSVLRPTGPRLHYRIRRGAKRSPLFHRDPSSLSVVNK